MTSPTTPPSLWRLVVADDHLLVRTGISALLRQLGHTVVAEAGNGEEALAAIVEHTPGLALVDIAMPVMSGIEVVRRATVLVPQTKLLYLSALTDANAVRQALHGGGVGYLLKDFLLDELAEAMNWAMRGDRYLRRGLPESVHHEMADGDSWGLTRRQIQVLRGLANGLSIKQIARELELSPKTVEFHRAKLSERLGIRDVAGLALYAARAGLVLPGTVRSRDF